MSNDYHMQLQEIEEQQERNIMHNAAIYIIKGISRQDAIKKARDLDFLQRDAEEKNEVIINGEDNEIIEGYFDSSLDDPSEKNLKKDQIKAIYYELCESEGISPE